MCRRQRTFHLIVSGQKIARLLFFSDRMRKHIRQKTKDPKPRLETGQGEATHKLFDEDVVESRVVCFLYDCPLHLGRPTKSLLPAKSTGENG